MDSALSQLGAKGLISIPDKIDGGPIIDFHGDDEVLALIAKTSSTEVIGFAKAKEYTQQLPFWAVLNRSMSGTDDFGIRMVLFCRKDFLF